jgi:superfamily II DNA or RNA helicase
VAELRDYQRETIDDFECLVAAGARSVLVTAPTAAGAASAEPAWRMVARQAWRVNVSLRPFQREIIDDFDRLVAGVRSVLLTVPTGSGKAVIATAIVDSAVAAGQRVA